MCIRDSSKGRFLHYGQWIGKKPPSAKQRVRLAVLAALEKKPTDFADFLRLMEAVSYTHLDVYKRQGAHRSELVGETALRHGSRFVRRKVREHPAKVVRKMCIRDRCNYPAVFYHLRRSPLALLG